MRRGLPNLRKAMPKFLVDENLSPILATFLQSLGYSAAAVRDVGLKGQADAEIISWCKTNNCVIITRDLGFGLIYSQSKNPPGIILLRSKIDTVEIFEKILSQLHEEGTLKKNLIKSLVVASNTKHRVIN